MGVVVVVVLLLLLLLLVVVVVVVVVAVSLLYLVFKTTPQSSVLSGCFVPRVSPSLSIWSELLPARGLRGSELAFRRPKSARKMHAKSFGP